MSEFPDRRRYAVCRAGSRRWRTCRFGHATGAITALTSPNMCGEEPISVELSPQTT
jgi:hypothetical protein